MERTLQWLQDQDFSPYENDDHGDMVCTCTGRGRNKPRLRQLRAPRVALLELQLQMQDVHFKKPTKPAMRTRRRPAEQKPGTVAPQQSSSSSCPEPEGTKPRGRSRGRAKLLGDRVSVLNKRPGFSDSNTNISTMSSMTGPSVTSHSPAHDTTSSQAPSAYSNSIHSDAGSHTARTPSVSSNHSNRGVMARDPCVHESPSGSVASHDDIHIAKTVSLCSPDSDDARSVSSAISGQFDTDSENQQRPVAGSGGGSVCSVGDDNYGSDVFNNTDRTPNTCPTILTSNWSPNHAFNIQDLVKKHVSQNNGNSTETTRNIVNNDMSHDQFKDSDETQEKQKKFTLFEHALTDNGQRIIFENHVKFHGKQPAFKGFSFKHLKTPETFTKEHDFPTLPSLPTKLPVPHKERQERIKTSLKDLACDMLGETPDVLHYPSTTPAPKADPPGHQHSDKSASEAEDEEESGPPGHLYIHNLPPGSLSKDGREFLTESLRYYGRVLEFEQIQNGKSSSVRVKFPSINQCQYASECYDGVDSIYPEYILHTEVKEIS